MTGDKWLNRLNDCFDTYVGNMRSRLLQLQPTRPMISSDGLGTELDPPTSEEWIQAASTHVDSIGGAILDCMANVVRDVEAIKTLTTQIEMDKEDVDLKVRQHAQRSNNRDRPNADMSNATVTFLSSQDIKDDEDAAAMVLARRPGAEFPMTSEEALHHILSMRSVSKRGEINTAIEKLQDSLESMYSRSFVSDTGEDVLAFHINNDPEEPRLIVNTNNFNQSAQEMDREVVFYRQKHENFKHAKYKQRMYNDSVAIATLVESLALRKAALSVVNANESDVGAVWDVVTDNMEKNYRFYPQDVSIMVNAYKEAPTALIHRDLQEMGTKVGLLSAEARQWTKINKTSIYLATTLASIANGLAFVTRLLRLQKPYSMEHIVDLFVTTPSFLQLNTFRIDEGVQIWRHQIYDWIAETELTAPEVPAITVPQPHITSALSFSAVPTLTDTLMAFLQHVSSLQVLRADGRA